MQKLTHLTRRPIQLGGPMFNAIVAPGYPLDETHINGHVLQKIVAAELTSAASPFQDGSKVSLFFHPCTSCVLASHLQGNC